MKTKKLPLCLAMFGLAAGVTACGTPPGAEFSSAGTAASALVEGAHADAVLFQPNMNVNDNARTTGAGFDFNTGTFRSKIAVGNGYLWVPDYDNNRVLAFDITTVPAAGADAAFVLGQIDPYENDGDFITLDERLYYPRAVTVDSEGRVYVAAIDGATGLDMVVVYDNPTTNAALSAYRLVGVPGDLVSLKMVELGANGTEHVAVVAAGGVEFYPLGAVAPTRAYTLESIPCSGSISDISQYDKTLLLACAVNAGRCLEGTYTTTALWYAPANSCPGVYPYRIDAQVDANTYRLPPIANDDYSLTYYTIDYTQDRGSTTPMLVSLPAGEYPLSIAGVFSKSRLYVATSYNRVLTFNFDINTNAGNLFDQNTPATPPDGNSVGPNDADPNRVYGQADLTGTGPNRNEVLPARNSLDYPAAIVVESDGNTLWILDRNNFRVMSYSVLANNDATSVLGQPNYTVGYQNRLEPESVVNPIGLAINASGQLYVSDSSTHRILIFDDIAGIHQNPIPSAVIGQRDEFEYIANSYSKLVLDDPAAIPSPDDLNTPQHMAFDPIVGQMFVSDGGNGRILVYNSGNTSPSAVLNADDLDSGANFGFNFRHMAAYDETLFVGAGSGGDANRIFMYNLPPPTTIGDSGIPARVFGQDVVPNLEFSANSQDRGRTTPAADTLDDVRGMAIEPTGGGTIRLWVCDADNNRVLWFDDAASVLDEFAATTADGVVGQPTFNDDAGWGGLGAPTVNNPNPYGFQYPRALAVDPQGGLWVADSSAHRLLYFPTPTVPDPETGMPKASMVLGQPDFEHSGANIASFDANGNPILRPTAFTLNAPIDIAVDSSGRFVAVVDSGNNRVLRYFINNPPTIEGGGVYEVEEGNTLTVPLVVTDPDGDGVDAAVIEKVAPESAAAAVTLSGSTLSYTAPLGSAGTIIRVTITATDQSARAATGNVSVIITVIEKPEDGWTPGTPQPTPRTPPNVPEGCLCGSTTPTALPLLVGALALIGRRRRRR